MKRRLILGGCALVVLAAVAAPKVLPLLHGDQPAPELRAARAHGTVLRVQTIVARPTPLDESVIATGSLRADEEVELQAETNGKIVAIHFREGALVQRGDLLVKLNDADLQASLQRAAARKRLAEIRERRLALLVAQGGANRQDYDAAASELEVQSAEIALISAQITKTEIRAPFDGILGLRFVSEGSFVSAASRIATLQKLESLKIEFAVPERYANRIRSGQPVRFSVAGDARQFTGEVYAAEPRIDLATRTVLVRAVFDNTSARLLPGAFASIDFTLDRIDDALLIPQVAVISGLTDKNVFVVDQGRAARRDVRTGVRTADAVQIVAGLTAGEVVIVSGLESLRHGSPVESLAAP